MSSSTTTSSSPDTIERILSLCPRVHIYSIPPLTSNKGHTAASWTADPARQIFTARLRVLESATPIIPSPSTTTNPNINNNLNDTTSSAGGETITITILLEDPSTGALFAAAPYTAPSVVEPAQDSSRFFAVRVVGEGGVTAMLGVGFEDRAEAVDFGICLAEGRKVLGFDGGSGGVRGDGRKEKARDWSLKEGETIKIDVGGRGRGRRNGGNEDGDGRGSVGGERGGGDAKAALFSIKPPPPPPSSTLSSSTSGGTAPVPLLAPPPSAGEARAERRRSREVVLPPKKSEAEAAGFDDGEFGEFQ